MTILTFENSKLGGMIAQVNMPVGVTCRENAPCFKGCYGKYGNGGTPSVKKGHMNRYSMYLQNPDGFFAQLSGELAMCMCKYVRWHAFGDIPDDGYFLRMCRLARKHKEKYFLCFTKKFEIVNKYLAEGHRIPKNLTVILSSWVDWIPENPFNLPTAYVECGIPSLDEVIPESALVCSGNCQNCCGGISHCWHMGKGESVRFHLHGAGAKSEISRLKTKYNII